MSDDSKTTNIWSKLNYSESTILYYLSKVKNTLFLDHSWKILGVSKGRELPLALNRKIN